MLEPKTIANVDEATALGIATLWNDAIPFVRHFLDHQVDDIDDGIRQALECDSEECETHDVRHRDADDCPCWGCDNANLLTMAQDARHWLDDIDANGTAYGHPPNPQDLLSLVTDWMFVNSRAPYTQLPAYKLGSVYRLLAELADQSAAIYATYTTPAPHTDR